MSMEIASAVSAVADVVNATLVLVGLLIAWVQWRKAKEVTRSEHLHSIIAAFKQDEIAQTFYRFIKTCSLHYLLSVFPFQEPVQASDLQYWYVFRDSSR